MKNFMKWTGIVLGGLIGQAVLAGVTLYPIGMKKLTRSYPGVPVEAVNIPTGADAIGRGRHITIVWVCTKCHGEDLSGMLLANDPFLGAIPASNLTAGKGGVAERHTDSDWIRAIRQCVKLNDQGEIFMYNYSTMSDQDLGGLIAYLKQIPTVDSRYPDMQLRPIVPIVPAI
jgi:hypothetical protein